MHRCADPIVLLEHDDADTARGETTRSQESRGAGADHDDITIRNPCCVL
jgi:hypothetical protein